jgi:Zn-dependent protease
MFGAELTLQLVVVRLFAGIIIATVQGASIAAAAVLLGDKGPRYDGRLTLALLGHIDLVGIFSMALSGFGWGKPVAIEAAQLRFGRWGLVIAVLAGSIALLVASYVLLLLVIPLLTLLPYTAGLTAAAFVRLAARLCVWMALFTLLPLPPLAGAHFLEALGVRLPARATLFISWGLLLVSLFGITRMVLTPVYAVIAPLILGPEIV